MTTQSGLSESESGGDRKLRWIERRRHRYKAHPTIPFEDVRAKLKTGDIIFFHKTTRTGLIDSIELDFISPVFFRDTEFRHSGVILKQGEEITVLECADETHSGHTHASYPTGGRGIRIVPLEPLLEAYGRDNGNPHYGVRFISNEIPVSRLLDVLGQFGPIAYLRMQRSIPLILTRFLLPNPVRRKVLGAFRHEMMCSEFVHNILNQCGALGDYQSKLVAPYSLEDDRFFRRLELVPFSDIVRFSFPAANTR